MIGFLPTCRPYRDLNADFDLCVSLAKEVMGGRRNVLFVKGRYVRYETNSNSCYVVPTALAFLL